MTRTEQNAAPERTMSNRLISFSLYGDDPRYRDGALENLALARTVYPGWSVRYYVSQEIPESLVTALADGGAQIVRKQRRAAKDGMFWRFLAAGDPGIDVCLVRDADSRIGARERRAVEAWLQSGRGFHIMRDNPAHCTLIMGGMWGSRRGPLADIERLLRGWDQYADEHTGVGADQAFLAGVVYPLVRDDALIHSDFVAYEGEEVLPFPTAPDASRAAHDPASPEIFVGAIHPTDPAGAVPASARRPTVYPLPGPAPRPKTYLLSSPDNDSSWVRYIVEWISERATMGCRDNPADRPLFINRLDPNPLAHVDDSLPLILFTSHGEHLEDYGGNRLILLAGRRDPEQLRTYERWSGAKLYITQEDLEAQPRSVVDALVEFLLLEPTRADAFLDDYEGHRKSSRALHSHRRRQGDLVRSRRRLTP